MARSIFVTALAALTGFGLFMYALQFQRDATSASLPSSANATNGTYEAWNTTTVMYPETTTALATYLPYAFSLVIIVFVLVMLYLAAGGR